MKSKAKAVIICLVWSFAWAEVGAMNGACVGRERTERDTYLSRNLHKIESGRSEFLREEALYVAMLPDEERLNCCSDLSIRAFNYFETGETPADPLRTQPAASTRMLEELKTKYGADRVKAKGSFIGEEMGFERLIEEVNAMKIGDHAIVFYGWAGKEYGHFTNAFRGARWVTHLDLQHGYDVYLDVIKYRDFPEYLDVNMSLGKFLEGKFGFLKLK